ncbi:MAG: 16S rRNA (cytidine(1402)-2'-O)-methyltransferase [bacterium]|nr:16S rRNA (cytidine(1402)-2'-O)-methyltransferase [bacterium]
MAAPGVLWVVATPIGNLEDVTLRALRVLREADVVAAEDTRRTKVLLAHHGIERPLVAYYDAVERARAPQLVARLLAGERVALVSDAGTPGINDPGYHLVREAIAAGVPVVPIPGPSAVTALVSIAGIPAERFVFEGFLPARRAARRARLEALAGETRATVFLEAGRRLADFLADAADVLGDRDVVVGRELTKLHEEVRRGRLVALRDAVAAEPVPLGELTLLVSGATEAPAPSATALDDAIRAGLAAGQRVRDVADAVAGALGVPRREVYRRALALVADGRGD